MWRPLVRSMSLTVVQTAAAPAAIGPYSQAIVANGFAFVSGQIPLDATGQLVAGDVKAQTEQVLKNLTAVLAAAGTNLQHVVKTTVFLKDMGTFPQMNEVYASVFGESKPARATVEVARLPRDVQVEIECVAVVPQAQ
eukprot:m.26569 g.26569  ORF g.26569 m.26569 type:complete len:138 (+) comp4308_c0_seq1:1539-1952(+)